jgi:exosortase/archaeosortase family protein
MMEVAKHTEGGIVSTAVVEKAQRLKAPRLESSLRGIAIIVATTVAYHRSLWTLMRNLALDTPLAYLGLIPLISAGLAYSALRNNEPGPPIHDRQVDFIVGVPLLIVALYINLLMPAQLSSQYWIYRLDMVSLPLFVAGASMLLYGLRPTWRARWAVIFLMMAWPYPYTIALLRWLEGFTQLTISTIAFAVRFIPVATHVATGDGSTFALTHGVDTFKLSVASSCSGANSLVGFFLIGGALISAVRGPRLQKFLWMFVGAALTWLLNVVRIMVIFAVGQKWGQKVAIDAFHPVLGLILFNMGIGILCFLLPRFGMRIGRGKGEDAIGPQKTVVPTRKWVLAIPVVAAVMLTLGLANSGLSKYGLIASDLGIPRLDSFAKSPPKLPNWNATVKTDSYDFARRFFGDDSTWNRYSMSSAGGDKSDLWASTPILADVITGSSLTRLETWGLEACYNFHGYEVKDQQTVDLGGGIKGTTLRFRPKGFTAMYSTVFWHWPVLENGKIRYERVTLMLRDDGNTKVRFPDSAFASGIGDKINDQLSRGKAGIGATNEHDKELENYMVAVGRQVVANQSVAPKKA